MRWQYYVVSIEFAHAASMPGTLNAAGNDGWELVSVTTGSLPTGSFSTFFFKRPHP